MIRWLAGFLLLLMAAGPAQAQTFPKFTGLVVDNADILSPATEAALTTKLQALQRDTRRQFVVATIADMQGYPLEEYGYRLGRAWGVGLGDVDNGAILFVAPNEPAGRRGPRLEVGRGLEPILTDAFASVTIREQMVPRLRADDIDGAMTAGTDAVIAQLRASPEEAQARVDAAVATFDRTHRRTEQGDGDGGVPVALIFWLAVLGCVVLPMILRGRGRGQRYRGGDGGGSGALPIVLWTIANEIGRNAGGGGGWGSGRGGSGSSGGGWGGGGFTGGGGGDFGGGGASGDW